jgi:hypothetical protein
VEDFNPFKGKTLMKTPVRKPPDKPLVTQVDQPPQTPARGPTTPVVPQVVMPAVLRTPQGAQMVTIEPLPKPRVGAPFRAVPPGYQIVSGVDDDDYLLTLKGGHLLFGFNVTKKGPEHPRLQNRVIDAEMTVKDPRDANKLTPRTMTFWRLTKM